jgi:hypothetical protein
MLWALAILLAAIFIVGIGLLVRNLWLELK